MNLTRDEKTQRPLCLPDFFRYVNGLNAKWWHDPATGFAIQRNKGQMRMLMISEISEAMEGERKNLMDDKLPHRRMAEVEMADLVIRLADYTAGWGYEIRDRWPDRLDIKGRELVPTPLLHWKHYTKHSDKGELLELLCCDVINIGRPGRIIAKTEDFLAVLLFNAEYYCWLFGYDLWGAVWEKLEYNKTRLDHQAEARLRAGGKAW